MYTHIEQQTVHQMCKSWKGMVIFMNNKNDFIEKILNKKGKEKILIVLLIGILLMVIAIPVKDESKNNNSFIGSQDTNNDMYTNWLKDYNSDITSYSTFIEEKLKNILSKVEGVGEVNVMVKINEDESIEGVIVVAGGGGNGTVSASITSAIEALLGIPAHKIKVLKMV